MSRRVRIAILVVGVLVAGGATAALLAAGHHEGPAWERLPGSFALLGALGGLVLIALARAFATLFARPEPEEPEAGEETADG